LLAYLLKLKGDTFYTGSTKNLKKRLSYYRRSKVKATRNKLPAKLVWAGVLKNKKLAKNFGTYLKSSSGKAFRNKRLI